MIIYFILFLIKMMFFLTIYDELNILIENVPFTENQNSIYRSIIEYFQLKKYAKKGNQVDLDQLRKLKEIKNTHVYHYINTLKFLSYDKSSKIYICLRKLVKILYLYIVYMESTEEDEMKEYFLEYDIYTLLHLFHYIEKNDLKEDYQTMIQN
jgi:hypothetical protein